MKCDNCYCSNTYTKDHNHTYHIKGKKINFVSKRRFCENCNNLVYDKELDNLAGQKAIEIYNKNYGIPKENSYGHTNFIDNKDLESYKENLREKRLKIGAIVMNCNPFTLGHKTLIEYAAARVHKLFVIVVSEDKSEFKFVDRFELVKRGTEKFPNVEVLQTEKFISSVKTFSGYFNKENLQDVYVDSTENDEMFAAEIAPSLGITIRFDGEEPRDNVTRQQNENLDVILPRYGIEHCIIPRREINGEVISAKTVRAALKVGDFEKISKLVPITTLQFLRKNYAHSTPPRCRLTIIKLLLLILIKSARVRKT